MVIPADAPDLPGLVLAKIFKVLHRVDLAIAPQRGGSGCVAIGVALPLADWIDPELLDLDGQPHARLAADRSRRSRWSLAPDWHRLRTPADVHRLDPGPGGLGGDPGAAQRHARWPAADGRPGISGATLADRFRAHAGSAQHLYGYAMRGMADDWEAGGPVRTLLRRLRTRPARFGAAAAAAGRRVPAGAHRPRPGAGPVLPVPGGCGPAGGGLAGDAGGARRAPAELRAALEVPPQTNEIGRSAALLAGLFDVVAATGVRRDPAARGRRQRGAQPAGRPVRFPRLAAGASVRPTRRSS